jgi:hypothetical protein
MQKNTSSFKKIALVIAVTGLFALVGSLIFFAYAEFLAANPMSLHETELFAFKEILYAQTNGNPTTIEDVIAAADTFFYQARSLGGLYAELKLIKQMVLSSLIPGLIGLILSIAYLNKEKVKSRISEIGEQVKVRIPNKKQLLIAVIILCLSTYLMGTLGYRYRTFTINRNPATYYTKVFEKRNGQPLDPVSEEALTHFLRAEAFILEGVREKEAEEAKSTFQTIGFILGLVIVGLMLYPSKLEQLKTNIQLPQTTMQVPPEASHEIQAWYYQLTSRLRQMDKRKLLGALAAVIILLLVIKLIPSQSKAYNPENNQSAIIAMEEEEPEDLFELISNGDVEKVQSLLAENILDLDGKNEEGITPLMVAALLNEVEIASLLLDHGAQIDIQADVAKGTALSFAVLNDNYETAALLLDRGANPDAKDNGDNTPLMYAITNNNPDLAELLLAYGASPYETNDFGLSAVDAAHMHENDEILALLIPGQAPELSEPMEEASEEEAVLLTQEEAFSILLSSQNIEADQEAIEHGACLSRCSWHSPTPDVNSILEQQD